MEELSREDGLLLSKKAVQSLGPIGCMLIIGEFGQEGQCMASRCAKNVAILPSLLLI